jgi:hypothetical protein
MCLINKPVIVIIPGQDSTVEPGMRVTDAETSHASPCMPCETVATWPVAQAGLGEHNYCRNPFNDPNGPWCFTNSAESRWEYCPVPACSTSNSPSASPTTSGPPVLFVLDADRLEAYDLSYQYAGTLATTSSGGSTSSDSGALGRCAFEFTTHVCVFFFFYRCAFISTLGSMLHCVRIEYHHIATRNMFLLY